MIAQHGTTVKTSSSTLNYSEMGNVICNPTSNITITLPGPNDGLWYDIVNVGTGIVTVSYNNVVQTTLVMGEVCKCCTNSVNEWFTAKGGKVRFTELIDTPSDYSGKRGKVPVVNYDENGLEFVDVNATHILSKRIEVGTFVGKDGYILAYSETTGGFYLKADEGGGGGEGGEEGNDKYSIRSIVVLPTIYPVFNHVFHQSKAIDQGTLTNMNEFRFVSDIQMV